MKIKTNELLGAALDWAVAHCLYPADRIALMVVTIPNPPAPPEPKFQVRVSLYPTAHITRDNSSPFNADWLQGGLIIEREDIRLTPDQGATYVESVWFAGSANEDGEEFSGEGPRPLIAAMRCYVASKLGDTVEVTCPL